MIVYQLYHIREFENGWDDEKLIGIYTTKEKAEAALRRAIGLPGFRDYPDGFEIFEHFLDHDSWTEGFISSEEAEKPRD